MIFGISKTTIEGWMSFLITSLTFISGYQGFTAILNPQASHTWLIITVVATFLTGLFQVWLRQVQGDAPTSAQVASVGGTLVNGVPIVTSNPSAAAAKASSTNA